ncbi:Hpt domain-containing protein [Magnetovibrio sp.]|uniref:Hpt domain-containing protein n=1 Tax=Magnetovibrio sp. TaxID=2024836 RepID=UPI002F931FD2
MSVEDMSLPEALDGFDLTDGLERMLGSPEIYLKFMLKFVQDHADDARGVRENLQKGDRDTAQRLAHTVKGVSGNLSAHDLYAAASRLSDQIKQGVEDLDGALDAFESELKRAVAAVHSLNKV